MCARLFALCSAYRVLPHELLRLSSVELGLAGLCMVAGADKALGVADGQVFPVVDVSLLPGLGG